MVANWVSKTINAYSRCLVSSLKYEVNKPTRPTPSLLLRESGELVATRSVSLVAIGFVTASSRSFVRFVGPRQLRRGLRAYLIRSFTDKAREQVEKDEAFELSLSSTTNTLAQSGSGKVV